MNRFTFYTEVKVEVEFDDILDNLHHFNDRELKILRTAINDEIEAEDFKLSEEQTIEQEQKIKILNELFEKYSWAELEKLKKIKF